jgi:hypothetical protein
VALGPTVKPPAAPGRNQIVEPVTLAFVKPEKARDGVDGFEVSTFTAPVCAEGADSLPTRSEILSR